MKLNPFDQFEIKPIFPLSLFGYDISFTNSSLSIMTICIIVFISSLYIKYNKSVTSPSTIQILYESIVEFVKDIIIQSVGRVVFLPFFVSLFIFILFGNLIGLVPGFFTFTSHIIVTFVLALMVILFTICLGIYKQRFKFLRLFFPKNIPILLLFIIAPIEIFTFFGRVFSLSLRLFANMLAGHIMLDILFNFIHSAQSIGGYIGAVLCILGSILLIAYEVFVSSIQAYIFTVLSCTYIKDGLESH